MSTEAINEIAGEYATLPMIAIATNPDNPRRITDKHPSLPALAQSIKETGLINPITVRALPEEGYEILAGERRWRAAQLAGLEEIACRIVKVTEAQAFHIITVENLQREDLSWLEEARGVAAMVARKWDVATIAKHVGRSEQWVRLRAKLASISPIWRKLVEDETNPLSRWPAAMLELIARFPVEQQDAMLKGALAHRLGHCESAAELQEFLDEYVLRVLRSAPWALADTKLVAKAGSCAACPKRSSCQQQLFAEAKEDTCLDASCWETKQNAHLLATIAAARKADPKVVLVGNTYDAPKALQSKVRGEWEFKAVKEGAKGAVPAVFVTGDKAGTTGWVSKERGAERVSTTATGEKAKPASPKVRLAAFLKRRHAHEVLRVVALLGGNPEASPYAARYANVKAAPAGLQRPTHDRLVALALALGVKGHNADWKVYARLEAGPAGDREDALWNEVRGKAVVALLFDANRGGDTTGARAMAISCGLDWKSIVVEIRDAMPLPKTLAEHFDQNGAPLKALAVKPAAKSKPKAKTAAAK